jgi:hypothetical protein
MAVLPGRTGDDRLTGERSWLATGELGEPDQLPGCSRLRVQRDQFLNRPFLASTRSLTLAVTLCAPVFVLMLATSANPGIPRHVVLLGQATRLGPEP